MAYASVRRALSQAAHRFYVLLVRPRSHDEDAARREFILNVILLGSLFLMLVSETVVIVSVLARGAAYRGIPLAAFSGIVLFFALIYLASRIGYWRVASAVLVLTYLASTTYGSYRWGPRLPAALLSYTLIIVIAGILFGTRGGFAVAFAIAAILFALGYLESRGILLPQTYWHEQVINLRDVAEFSSMLFLVMVVSWLSNREIEKSLARARRSEAETKKQKDFLEIKVEERTRELKKSQLQRISQVYRFAEFGKLASGFFHDLMNPLASMSLHIEQMDASGGSQATDAREKFSGVLDAAKRMEHFIQGIRKQLADQDAAELFSLSGATEEVVMMLEYKARKAGVRVRLAAEKNIIHCGNLAKFQQVALNLISNGIDACEANPRASPRDVCVTIQCERDRAVMEVRDNGAGIPGAIAQKIFEPFFTTKGSRGGVGIGLSLTKEIVERSMRGTIAVRTGKDEGTVFTVQFPVVRSAR